MKDALILKNRLKEARTEKKLSQSAFAQLVGVSRNTRARRTAREKGFVM